MFVRFLSDLSVWHDMCRCGRISGFSGSPQKIIIKIASNQTATCILAENRGPILAGVPRATMSTLQIPRCLQQHPRYPRISFQVLQKKFSDEKKSLLLCKFIVAINNCLISCKGSEFQRIPYRKLCMGGIWRCIPGYYVYSLFWKRCNFQGGFGDQ